VRGVAGNLDVTKISPKVLVICHRPEMLLADLVTKALRRNDGDFIAKALVGLEVQRQLGVVTLDDDLGGLLDGLNLLKCISVCFASISNRY
jgi:hypothetical protein